MLSRDLRRLSKIISKAKEAKLLSDENDANGPSASQKSSQDRRPATFLESHLTSPQQVESLPKAQVRHKTAAAERHAQLTSSRGGSSAAPMLDMRPPRRHVSWGESTNAPQARSICTDGGQLPQQQTQQPTSSGKAFVEDLHDKLVQAVGPYVHAYLSLPPGVNPLLPHVSGPSPRSPTALRPRPQPPPPPPNPNENDALGVHLAPRFLVYEDDLRTWAARVTAPDSEPIEDIVL